MKVRLTLVETDAPSCSIYNLGEKSVNSWIKSLVKYSENKFCGQGTHELYRRLDAKTNRSSSNDTFGMLSENLEKK